MPKKIFWEMTLTDQLEVAKALAGDGWEPYAVTECYGENHNGESYGGSTFHLRRQVEKETV